MLRWGVSTKVEMLHPCNIDPLVPELVRREPHNTHTCQSTECTAESYACSQTNYIISLPPEKKIVVMCIKTLSLSFTSRAMNAWCQCFWPQLCPGRGCLHKRLWSTSQPRQTPPSQSSWLGHPPGLCDVSNSWGIESGPVILHLPVTQELGHSRITLTDSFSRTMARTSCSSVPYSLYTSCSMSSWLLVVQGQDNGHCSPWTQPSGRYQGWCCCTGSVRGQWWWAQGRWAAWPGSGERRRTWIRQAGGSGGQRPSQRASSSACAPACPSPSCCWPGLRTCPPPNCGERWGANQRNQRKL